MLRVNSQGAPLRRWRFGEELLLGWCTPHVNEAEHQQHQHDEGGREADDRTPLWDLPHLPERVRVELQAPERLPLKHGLDMLLQLLVVRVLPSFSGQRLEGRESPFFEKTSTRTRCEVAAYDQGAHGRLVASWNPSAMQPL